MKPKLILIIEDDYGINDMLSMLLQQHGYDVICVDSGVEGMRVTEEMHPDLILLDMMLPDIIGLEICSLLRDITRVPIIFMSARHEVMESMSSLKLGADAYIVKPFNNKKLVALIEEHLMKTPYAAEPVLPQPRKTSPLAPRVFVLMPSFMKYQYIYDYHIRKVIEDDLSLQIQVSRDFFLQSGVMERNSAQLNAARLVIADCTDRSPAVFYALGMAKASSIEVILIAQNLDDIPADMRRLPYIVYTTSAAGMSEFEEHLKEYVAGVMDLPQWV